MKPVRKGEPLVAGGKGAERKETKGWREINFNPQITLINAE
jgi:hypothetical protein